MKHLPLTKACPTTKKQDGGMLIESLIGVLIMAILGGGIMHVTSRMLNTQHDTAVANVVVNELRPLIMSRNVCVATTGSASSGSGSSESTTYTAANKTINVPGAANGMAVTTTNCTPTTVTIKQGNTVVATVTQAPQPIVLTVGNSSDGSLVKVGGQ
ncbi:MAG: hypothetical protein U5M23_12945 [Marinagarivorans sp.]|nr:hypothetical protein [Marinagarivorans sp.]